MHSPVKLRRNGHLFFFLLRLPNIFSYFILFFKYIYWLCYYSCPISLVLLEVNKSSEFRQCLWTNTKKAMKSMKSNAYFLGKGFDLSALDRGLSKSTSSETVEMGLLETTPELPKAMEVGWEWQKEQYPPGRMLFQEGEDKSMTIQDSKCSLHASNHQLSLIHIWRCRR